MKRTCSAGDGFETKDLSDERHNEPLNVGSGSGQCHVIAGSAFRMRTMLKSKLKLYTFGECEIGNAEEARENCIKDVGRAGNMISGTIRFRLTSVSLNPMRCVRVCAAFAKGFLGRHNVAWFCVVRGRR